MTTKEVKTMQKQIDDMTKTIEVYEGQMARQQVQIRMLQEFANSIIQRGNQLQMDAENLNKALSVQENSE